MKKTVFLLLLIVIFVFSVENKIFGSDDYYQIDNSEFIITGIEENGVNGFTIEKTGVNPFYSKVIDSSEHYFITGIKEIRDYYILYGYGFSRNSDTEYDSLYFVLDHAGNIINKDLRDYGNMESIKDIFYIDDVLITYTESVIDNDYTYQFKTNFFTSFDQNFNFLDSIEIGKKVYQTKSNDTFISIGYNKEEYDLGIKSDLSLIDKNDLLSIKEGEVYTETVSIEFINGATLNGEYIENGITLSYPGNYTLNYNNKIYNFTIAPIISGVVDNGIYSESITPKISGGNIMLNNDLYVSNTEIYNPGNYELTINGANNYVESLDFTITSNLKGITNNNVYFEPVNISYSGDGYLNNNFIQSPSEITQSGEYVLKIKGENNYMETYYFSIQKEVKKAGLIDFIQKVDIIVLVVVLVSGGIILKKK